MLPYFGWLVGSGKNFWRKGLQAVWGDSKKLKDSDVLRFQWPAIGKGWEDGLLTFTRAMAQPTAMTDAGLVEQVLQTETNATVTVILGSQDRVVRTDQVIDCIPNVVEGPFSCFGDYTYVPPRHCTPMSNSNEGLNDSASAVIRRPCF